MTVAVFASFTLICTTLVLHFAVLRLISAQLPQCSQCKPYVVLLAIGVIFLAHLIEIGVYALAYDWLSSAAEVGELLGQGTTNFMDYFYYSTVMYTSLGIGDVYPIEHLRIISGLETLNGLILIGWSTAFTFLIMRRYWFADW